MIAPALLYLLLTSADAVAPRCTFDDAAPADAVGLAAATEAAAAGDESLLLLQLTLNIDGAGKVQVQQNQANSEGTAGFVADAAKVGVAAGAPQASEAASLVVSSTGAEAEVPSAEAQGGVAAERGGGNAEDPNAFPQPHRIAVIEVPAEAAAAALGDKEASLLPEMSLHAQPGQLPWESAGMAVVGAVLIASGIVIPCFMLMLACASVSSDGGGGIGRISRRRDVKRASFLTTSKTGVAGSCPDAGAYPPSAGARQQEEPDAEPAPLEEDAVETAVL